VKIRLLLMKWQMNFSTDKYKIMYMEKFQEYM